LEEANADFVHSLCALLGPHGPQGCIGPPLAKVGYADHSFPPSSWLHRRELEAECGVWADPDLLSWPVDFDYSRRVALAGKSFAFHPRLTVLKFPSHMFPGAYASGDGSTQQRYLRRLRKDPLELERRTLQDLAIRSARREKGVGWRYFRTPRSWRESVGELCWPIGWRLIRLLKPDRGVLGFYLWWRFQRRRSSVRLWRGLNHRSVAVPIVTRIPLLQTIIRVVMTGLPRPRPFSRRPPRSRRSRPLDA
jgi:hypothetical protein